MRPAGRQWICTVRGARIGPTPRVPTMGPFWWVAGFRGVSGSAWACGESGERARPGQAISNSASGVRQTMKADFQTYRRATSTAILGLAIQAGLAVILFIYAYMSRDHAAMSAAIYAAIGLPAWVVLIILFDQHRRERVEAFEAESISSSEIGSSSVFDDSGDELRVAARRLRSLYKIFVPVFGLLVSGGLVGAGVLRLLSARNLLDEGGLPADRSGFFAIGAGVTIAVIGFIFARFVSGMAKQRVWAQLSAGAAFAVGTSLMGLAIAVGHFVDIAGPDTALRILHSAIPIVMIVLGAEGLITFLLELYRPRVAGDVVRLAYDSRVLGFVAAPDTVAQSIGEAINYQLGSEVTSSWFYKLLSRWVVGLVAVGMLVGWLVTAFVVVEPHQRGVLLQFGRVVKEDVEPGLLIKAPWPIQSLMVPEFGERDARGRITEVMRTATGVRTLELGTPPPSRPGPILWTNEHSENEWFTIVQTGDRAERARDGESDVARDFALVAVEVPLHYVVADPMAYESFAPLEMRDRILKSVGERAVMNTMSALTIEEILGERRRDLPDLLRRAVTEAYANLNPGPDGTPRGAGIEVLYVGAAGIHPPTETARSFENVVTAEQKREAQFEDAQKERIVTLTEAAGGVEVAQRAVAALGELDVLRQRGAPAEEIALKIAEIEQILESGAGQASRQLGEARSQRWTRHMRERARASRYQGQKQAYQAAPQVYKAQLYLEAIAEVMAGSRVFVVSEGLELRLRANYEDQRSAQDVFNPALEDEF